MAVVVQYVNFRMEQRKDLQRAVEVWIAKRIKERWSCIIWTAVVFVNALGEGAVGAWCLTMRNWLRERKDEKVRAQKRRSEQRLLCFSVDGLDYDRALHKVVRI
jgi:hypothetical protein